MKEINSIFILNRDKVSERTVIVKYLPKLFDFPPFYTIFATKALAHTWNLKQENY